jgi:hypothetical protein
MNDLSRQDPDYVVGMAPISAYPKRATGWGIGGYDFPDNRCGRTDVYIRAASAVSKKYGLKD